MRIDAGMLKGRKIPLPKGVELRPTSDKVKQALFNVVASGLEGAKVLDLFCGTGALGLEALSRGAGKVVFADKEARCVEAVENLLEKFSAEGLGQAEFLAMNAWRALGLLASREEKFDLVLLDPPYNEGLGSPLLQSRELVAILCRDGRAQVVLEHATGEMPAPGGGLELVKSRRYGSTSLSFFRPGLGGLEALGRDDAH